MKRSIKRKTFDRRERRILLNEMKKTLNRKLNPFLKVLASYRAAIEQNSQQRQSGHEIDVIHSDPTPRTPVALSDDDEINAANHEVLRNNTIAYKSLNLLLAVPDLASGLLWNVLSLEETFRHLVRRVTTVKYDVQLPDNLAHYEPDLVLVMGSGAPVPGAVADTLKALPAPKAVWLPDEQMSTMTGHQLGALADYIFTQSQADASVHRLLKGKKIHILPFAANTEVYYPRPIDGRFHSDVLIIGEKEGNDILSGFSGLAALKDRKVRVYGAGWEKSRFTAAEVLNCNAADYYNGAKIVVNCSGSIRCIHEVAACGVFQLVQQFSSLPEFKTALHPECSSVFFQTLPELEEQFNYYWQHADQRRLMATKTLMNVKYNHSWLQKAIQLLDVVFRS